MPNIEYISFAVLTSDIGLEWDLEMSQTISLTTDYLIIGAGALGMGFLDELINNSTSLEAIIVDQRDKPGGHWTEAYPFVRLHSPAVTYGLNSRPLGSGGTDLASQAQILSHFELALADLGSFRKHRLVLKYFLKLKNKFI